MLRIWNYCHNQTIDILYLGLLIFKKITICWGYLVFYEDFDPISNININIIIDILDNNKKFIINPKNNLFKFTKYIKNLEFNDFLNLSYDFNDKKKLNNLYIKYIIQFSNLINNNNIYEFKKIWDLFSYKDMNEIIKIHKTIKKDYFPILEKIIMENNLNKCLELNMSFGFTSLCIINSIKYLNNPKLIIIDEYQSKIWNNIGTNLLNKKKIF